MAKGKNIKSKTRSETIRDVDLNKVQEELDTSKYYLSESLQQDMSGEMFYCKGCDFQKADQEKGRCFCNLDRKSIVDNLVCAKNYIRSKK